jgi:hypothetical protein
VDSCRGLRLHYRPIGLALNTVRSGLDAALTVGGLPKFTVSFGLAEGDPSEDLDAVLRRADDALLKDGA